MYSQAELAPKKIFKGRCTFCEEIGHKSVDCWENKENKGKHQTNWTCKMTESQQTAGEHAFTSGKPFCTICYNGGHKAKTYWHKGGNKKKKNEQANTSAKTEGFLECVVMTNDIGIQKDDPDVHSMNRNMNKFMTNHQDLNDLQDWVSDKQWVDTLHNTSNQACEKVESEECHTSQRMPTESSETSTIHEYPEPTSHQHPDTCPKLLRYSAQN